MPKTHGKHWIIVNYSLGGSDSKDSACNSGHLGLSPGSGRPPGEGNGYLLQCSSSGKSHDQRSLAGYSLWGHKELDMIEWLTLSLIFFIIIILIDYQPLCLELISPKDIEILPTPSFFLVTNIRNFGELTSFFPGCKKKWTKVRTSENISVMLITDRSQAIRGSWEWELNETVNWTPEAGRITSSYWPVWSPMWETVHGRIEKNSVSAGLFSKGKIGLI